MIITQDLLSSQTSRTTSPVSIVDAGVIGIIDVLHSIIDNSGATLKYVAKADLTIPADTPHVYSAVLDLGIDSKTWLVLYYNFCSISFHVVDKRIVENRVDLLPNQGDINNILIDLPRFQRNSIGYVGTFLLPKDSEAHPVNVTVTKMSSSVFINLRITAQSIGQASQFWCYIGALHNTMFTGDNLYTRGEIFTLSYNEARQSTQEYIQFTKSLDKFTCVPKPLKGLISDASSINLHDRNTNLRDESGKFVILGVIELETDTFRYVGYLGGVIFGYARSQPEGEIIRFRKGTTVYMYYALQSTKSNSNGLRPYVLLGTEELT